MQRAWGIALLALTLLPLGACRDDLAEHTPAPGVPTKTYGPAAAELDHYSLVLDAAVEPQRAPGQARLVDFYVSGRDVKRGTTPTESDPGYPNEYAPSLGLRKGAKIPGVLVFMREKDQAGDPVTMFSQDVQFEVTQGLEYGDSFRGNDPANKQVEYRVRYVGDVAFPRTATLRKEWSSAQALTGSQRVSGKPTRVGQWYVMAILNYSATSENSLDRVYYGMNSANAKEQLLMAASNLFYGAAESNGASAGTMAYPLLSDWQQLKLVSNNEANPEAGAIAGFNDQLTFRPQGMLIQLDLQDANAITQGVDIIGLASTDVDFSGYYDLTDKNALYSAFAGRAANKGMGLPTWKAEPLQRGLSFGVSTSPGEMNELFAGNPYERPTMRDASDPSFEGMSSEEIAEALRYERKNLPVTWRFFAPYNYPSISWNIDGVATNDLSGRRVLAPSKPISVTLGTLIPKKVDKEADARRLQGWPSNVWSSQVVSGRMVQNGRWVNPVSRLVRTFWAMPRKASEIPAQPSERFTVAFASSLSVLSEDMYTNALDIEQIEKEKSALRDIRVDIRAAERRAALYEQLIQDEQARIAQLEQAPAGESSSARSEREAALALARTTLRSYQGSKQAAEKLRDKIIADNRYTSRKAKNDADLVTADQARLDYFKKRMGAVRSQPIIPLAYAKEAHASMRAGSVAHLQGLMSPNLQISKVIYNQRDGYNYSMIELYNPSALTVDLNLYGLVRLVPNGNKLSYRKADGSLTDDLKDAQIYSLSLASGIGTDLFGGYGEGSGYSLFMHRTYRSTVPNSIVRWMYSNVDDPAGSVALHGVQGESPAGGTTFTREDQGGYRIPLLPNQSVLVGASGFYRNPVFTSPESRPSISQLVDAEGWFKSWYEQLEESYNSYFLRFLFAGQEYASSGAVYTLDLAPGEAVALVCSSSLSRDNLQVVDASGPIGDRGLAFAGSYAQFKAQMDAHRSRLPFAMVRARHVHYPFIAPFRTKKLTSAWADDWTIETDLARFDLGKRRTMESFGRTTYSYIQSDIHRSRTWVDVDPPVFVE